METIYRELLLYTIVPKNLNLPEPLEPVLNLKPLTLSCNKFTERRQFCSLVFQQLQFFRASYLLAGLFTQH